MRIYTKNGDAGDTDLYGGKRVRKSVEEIEVLGVLDELNAFLGLLRLHLREKDSKIVAQVQNDLFLIGSVIAGVTLDQESKKILLDRVNAIEKEIDIMDDKLPPLKNFILPNGCESSARVHLARAICRRSERCLVSLGRHFDLLPYLNRLSDYLFVLARSENFRRNFKDEVVNFHRQ